MVVNKIFVQRLSRNRLSKSLNYLRMSVEASCQSSLIADFKSFKFSPFKLLDLKIETNRDNYVRRFIKGVIFSHVNPTPLSNPKLVSFSEDALKNILDLDPSIVKNQEFIEFVTGNILIASSTPLAHRYGGHQFGVWASQLGDGRAILLGEYINRKGERWELQLKGSGKTPYSRDGDGRAVLRSSIREFLCSEAMHYLGIPTTRAGTITVSDDMVVRDPLYDGHPQLEPAAVVLRLAPSWFRIGSLEILSKYGEIEMLKDLLTFIVQEHFPEIEKDDNMIPNLLQKIFRLSCDLVVKWQSVGFTHGVLNTDNMSLIGLTIDYGPFGFMEDYDMMYVPNHSDSEARYCYGRQTQIILLNLLMLTKAVSPLLTQEQLEMIAKMLQSEAKYTDDKIIQLFSSKLGFDDSQPHLIEILLAMFRETKADFTMVFRELSETPLTSLTKPASKLWALRVLSKHKDYHSFVEKYKEELIKSGISDSSRMEKMCQINPCYVLRNWIGQQVIDRASSGDYSEVNALLKILKNPFSRQDEAERKGYADTPPSWSKSLCLSCSS